MNERPQSSQGSRTHSQPIRVLLVEDDPDHAFLIGKTLASSSPDRFEMKQCSRLDQGLEQIETGAADVVLLDLCLPDSKGLDTLVTLCERKPDLPVIVLTGAKDEDMAIEAVRRGAQDYLLKDRMNSYILSHVVMFAVERKKRQDLLRETEERFDRIIDNSEAGYFRLDEWGCFRTVNRAWLRLHGYARRDEVVGKPFSLTALPKDAQGLQELVGKVLGGQSVPRAEGARRCKDGTIGYHVYSVNPVRERNRVVGVEGFLLDITDRKRIEMDLEYERGQFLAIFDGIDEPVYISDPSSYDILYANKTLTRRFGEIVGQKCHVALQGMDAPCPFCTNDRILGHNFGRTHIWEWQNQKNRHWYRCIDRAIRWSDGRIVRSEIAIDITAQKRAEQEVERRNRQLAAIHAITSAANRSLDLEEVLCAALDEVCTVFQADGGVVYLTEDGGVSFHAVACSGVSPEELAGIARFKNGEGLAGVVAQSARALVISDLASASQNMSPAFRKMGWRSYAGMPIEREGQVSGVMELLSRREHRFYSHDMDLMRDLGRQMSLAIEKARIYEDARTMKDTLMESEEKYRRLFELTNEPALIFDAEHTVEAANPAAERWVGYTSAELEGKRLSDLPFLSDESKADLMDKLGQRLAGTDVPTFEIEVVTKEGRRRRGRTAGAVLRDNAGEATGQILTVKEVIATTGLREAAPLPQSQETLTDDVDVLMWFQVNSRTVGGGNRALAEFWGCAKGELAGRDIASLLWAKTGERYAEETERVFSGQISERLKTWNWLVDADGQRRRFAVTRAAHRRADGTVGYVACSAVELPKRTPRTGRSRAPDETSTHIE